MERHLEPALRDLKEQLVKMAGLVEKAIEEATTGLRTESVERLNEVYEIEQKIDQAHLSVDDACVKCLALHQPMAKDLRFIVAVIKMNTDLERMGDQAVNIAHNAEKYIAQEPLKPLVDLPRMFDEVKLMVREAIDSFVHKDETRAREVLLRDDRVDELKALIFDDVVKIIKQRPDRLEQGLSLILIARNLERLGDHATNIAEDVIFAISGEDIRHAPRSVAAQVR